MKIRVRWGYQGRPSRERYIEAVEYAIDDERLFGLGEYLLANGHAVEVTEVVEIPPPDPEPPAKPKPRRRRTTKAKTE